MGRIYPGVPHDLVLRLRDKFNVSHFIETGTHKGNTAFWASKEFKQTITIERSDKWHQVTKDKFSHVVNIEFVQGISGRSIPGLIIGIAGGALIYRGITGHCSVYERMEETHETHSEPVDGDWNSSGLKVVGELSGTA